MQIYSVDTSAFYNEDEAKLHRRQLKNYKYRSKFKQLLKSSKDYDTKKIQNNITLINNRLKRIKDKLRIEFSKSNPTRHLRNNHLIDKNIISVFESSLTRTLKIKTSTLSTHLFVVQVFFFEVLKDIVLNGFYYNDEKYVPFTASAGQLRVKKIVFIKESVLQQYQDTLMCGLTEDFINASGGVNINKFLAYKALFSSSTDEWVDFDIDKMIVVNDMELMVSAEVDYIDNKTYEINRNSMDVPINHTDGAGMMLPSVSKKNFMFRMPWFKGILTPFNFRQFIVEKNNGIGTVMDIWGKEWDLIKDDIQIICTKSQFKMHKFYKDWDDYKEKFKKYGCHAGTCNVEDDYIKDSRLNYQMIQTLTDVNENEIDELIKDTVDEIENISTDRNTMLSVLGATKTDRNKRPFNEAIEIYPELLTDIYTKSVLKDLKKSLVKEAKSGKLKINGKYLFLIPDMYAFCEWLILKNDKPKGLLNNGEVFCSIYKQSEKLNVLRSPHLFREHAIKKNIYDNDKKKWFITKGIYTSIHDPISKLLQFDNDGDKALVVKDRLFIEIAERNIKNDNIVPLYYEMGSANAEIININNTYGSLISAYKGSNIGEYSNLITKIWSSEKINLDLIRWLCMENNYKIDFAKTKEMPVRPSHIHKAIHEYTMRKVPYFFIYAKNKEVLNVDKVNNSIMNRICKSILNPRMNFKKMGKLDHRILMSGENKNVDLNKRVIDVYEELASKGHFMMNSDEEKHSNVLYHYKKIRDKILSTSNDINYTVDVLVEYLYKYKKSAYKTTLWMCFGEEILANIKRNVAATFGENTSNCEVCNCRIKITSNRRKYCEKCWKEKEKELKREWKRVYDRQKSRSLEMSQKT